MTPELLTKQCGMCGAWLDYDDGEGRILTGCDGRATFEDGEEWVEVAIFRNHTSANAAARAAGWMVQSESIGGDLCPRCLGLEGNAADDWRAYDESVAEQWHANIELKRERDEARAEVERLRGRVVVADEAYARGWGEGRVSSGRAPDETLAALVADRDEANRELREAKRERDKARAEVEVWQQSTRDAIRSRDAAIRERDEARAEALRPLLGTYCHHCGLTMAYPSSHCRNCGEPRSHFDATTWDTNDNGTIDDADELAAYAEASDLRALAERESE